MPMRGCMYPLGGVAYACCYEDACMPICEGEYIQVGGRMHADVAVHACQSEGACKLLRRCMNVDVGVHTVACMQAHKHCVRTHMHASCMHTHTDAIKPQHGDRMHVGHGIHSYATHAQRSWHACMLVKARMHAGRQASAHTRTRRNIHTCTHT